MAVDSELVHTSLKELIKEHTPDADLSEMDSVVVHYVVGVVEDAVAGESVDIEGVKEVVAAYEPLFSCVSHHRLQEWIAATVAAIRAATDHGKTANSLSLDAIVSCFTVAQAIPRAPPSAHPTSAAAATQPVSTAAGGGRKQRNESSSISSSSGSSSGGSNSSCDIETLMELFPDACRVDVERYLHTTGGDVQEAICMMLDAPPPTNSRISAIENAVQQAGSGKLIDDKAVKASIIDRYSFIDHDDDRREHRPLMPKWEAKKMVRYRDNKVVSLKGERYTEIKKEEPADLKKTYVNLKPGRQYRFH